MKEIEKAQIVKALDGDEERYIVMRDRELLVSKAASTMDNCVKFYTHFEENGKEYYVLELCNAGDLTELKNKQPKKRFTECELRSYAKQIANGMN